MSETVEQARMANELNTIKATQDMLFPEFEAQFGPLEISSFYTPASECGGDWFNPHWVAGDRPISDSFRWKASLGK